MNSEQEEENAKLTLDDCKNAIIGIFTTKEGLEAVEGTAFVMQRLLAWAGLLVLMLKSNLFELALSFVFFLLLQTWAGLEKNKKVKKA